MTEDQKIAPSGDGEGRLTRETVVDLDGLASGLGVSRGIAAKMDLPFFMAGKRQRFIWGQVLDVLAERARSAA